MPSIRVGCAVVAEKDGRILLGRRGKEPFYGKWVIPGGGIDLFETLTETASREFAEETGLKIRVEQIVHLAEIISPPNEHRIVIYVSAEVVGGDARAGSDLLEINYFRRDQLEQLAAEGQLTPTVQQTLGHLGWIPSSPNQLPAVTVPTRLAEQRAAVRIPPPRARISGEIRRPLKFSSRRRGSDERQLTFW
jgi:8-oxo-dGTP diphosphatase